MRIFDFDLANSISVMRLPAVPGVLARLIEHCQAEDADLSGYAQLIGLDPGLTSKLLSAASSNSSGAVADLTSVEQAVTMLGPKMIQTLVINEAVSQSFRSAVSDRIDLRHFWKHSVTTAIIARLLAAKTGYPRIEEAYLAGLLHDIGRLALLSAFPQDYAGLFSQTTAALCVREQKLLRLTHAQAGAKLAEKWKLDSFLSDSILYHHEAPALLAKAHLLIRIVSVAHALSNDGPDGTVCAASAALLDVSAAELSAIHASAASEVTDLAQDIDIDLSRPAEAPILPGSISPPANDDHGRAGLSARVCSLILVNQARQTFNCTQGETELLNSVLQAARMLFACRHAIALQLNQESNGFVATSADQHSRAVSEFSISIETGGTLVENALAQRVGFIDHSSRLLGIIELQALRLLHAESLVCIPFGDSRKCAGMLLLGLNATMRHELHQRQGLLEAFGRQVSSALKVMTTGDEEMARQIEAVTEEFQAKAQRAAHEVNNPLAIIQNYFTVLERKLVKHELASKEIPLLREEIERIVHIVHGLCEFQPATTKTKVTDLRSVVQDVVDLFQQTEYLPPSVRLTLTMPDEHVDLETDIDMLKQILINLLKNGVEAFTHGGGEINVDINGRLANRDGRLYVALTIKDTGSGIPKEVMARLFSPVHSNKGAGYRGLGLSIVNNLVKTINGFITCHSDQNGTSFEILLPALIQASKMPTSPKYATRTALSL